MGRIKTTLVKRLTLKLFNTHRDSIKKDFEQNKKVVEELTNVESKKIRNIVAGYLTRLAKEKVE